MIKIFLVIGMVFCACNTFAQTPTARNYYDFVPNGYDTLGLSVGDLNGDLHDDVVMVCARKHGIDEGDESEDTDKRPLIILFWTPAGYQFVLRNDDVIECKGCGGSFGDPFAGTEITNGVLTVSHYSGSAWRWEFIRKFKWINNQMVLIGKTNRGYWDVRFCKTYNDYAGTDLEDINFLTGKRYRKLISEECKLLLDKWDRIKVKALVPLFQYKMDDTGE